jgi:HK97 family phage prohead protease
MKIATPFEVKEITDAGTFAGYGNVYGVRDQGDDIIAPGTFAESLKSLADKGRMPAMLWQHQRDEPIGVYQHVKEDGGGLVVEGKLALKTARGAEAYELLKMGAISGLSIGFRSREATFDKSTGVRTITKGDLWEVSLVTFPMNDDARIARIKSVDELSDLSEVEKCLRDAGGFSRSEAKALISRIVALHPRDADSEAEALKALAAVFSRRFSL